VLAVFFVLVRPEVQLDAAHVQRCAAWLQQAAHLLALGREAERLPTPSLEQDAVVW
jgi:hypothetical protein